MSYTKEQLTEMVNELPMSNETNLKFVLKKIIEKAPQHLFDAPLRVGNLIVYKAKSNSDQLNIQPGDMVQGYIGSDFIAGTYTGGDVTEINNFSINELIN